MIALPLTKKDSLSVIHLTIDDEAICGESTTLMTVPPQALTCAACREIVTRLREKVSEKPFTNKMARQAAVVGLLTARVDATTLAQCCDMLGIDTSDQFVVGPRVLRERFIENYAEGWE